jgi:hypothetical protein
MVLDGLADLDFGRACWPRFRRGRDVAIQFFAVDRGDRGSQRTKRVGLADMK